VKETDDISTPKTARRFPFGGGRTTVGHKGIRTVSLTVKGKFDLEKLNRWLASLLKERALDLFRMKGIIHVENREEMFIFHGVHMIFIGKEGPRWPQDEERVSSMVFIGRNIDETSLKMGFEHCCVQEQGISLDEID